MSRSGSTVMETKKTFGPKSRPRRALEARHLGGEERTGVDAARVDEGDGDDLAPAIGEGQPPTVLGGEGERRRRADPGEALIAFRLMTLSRRRPGQQRQQDHAEGSDRGPGT